MTEQVKHDAGSEVELILVADPVEGAFSLRMPKGWQNQAQSARPHGQHRSVVNTRSPNGDAFLFMGDPNLPVFVEPTSPGAAMVGYDPLSQARPYTPADRFFPEYVHQRYGQAAGFRITGVGPNPVLEMLTRESAQKRGIQAHVTAVRVTFEYPENGATVRGVVHGGTISMGEIWVADVSGILTTGDPARYGPVLFDMVRSYQTNPQWRQQQDNLHAQRMGQIQQDSQNWMATMQAGHQSRMDSIQQAGAVNTQIHNGRMAQSEAAHQSYMQTLRDTPTASPYASGPGGTSESYDDASHRRALNYIRDEETVVDGSGQTYRVETGHERYYLNRRDNTYIGTDSLTERDDLRKRGVNPDDYEEVTIRK